MTAKIVKSIKNDLFIDKKEKDQCFYGKPLIIKVDMKLRIQ